MSTTDPSTRAVNEETGRLIGQHPLPSVITAFAAGVGVGLLALALIPSASRDRDAAITRRLLDALSNVLPDTLAKRLP